MQLTQSAKENRSVVSATAVDALMRQYLSLTLSYIDPIMGIAKQELYYIFPENEYTITWISETGVHTTHGLVTSVSGNTCGGTITMKTLNYNGNDDTTSGDCYCQEAYQKKTSDPYVAARKQQSKTQDLSKCCVLTPKDTSKYNGPKTYTIPIKNITGVEYDLSAQYPCLPDKESEGGTKIVILGITARTIRAVIVRLELLTDNCPHNDNELVRAIDMEVGKRYKVVYMCNNKDKTIFEIEGTLLSIEENAKDSTNEDKPNNGAGTCTGNYCNSIVRKKTEQVGFNGSSYDCSCSYDEFMKSEPIDNDVKFIFDTSETFQASTEVVWLSMLRAVELIDTGTPDDPDEPEQPNPGPGCDCDTCPGRRPEPTEYQVGQATVVVDGGTVVIKGHGGPGCGCNPFKDTTVTMQEILQYYLGL